MWRWKPAKQMLDALFASGELVIADRINFQRRYDLPERVLPRDGPGRARPCRGGGGQGADREGRSAPGEPCASSRSQSTCGRSGAISEKRRRRENVRQGGTSLRRLARRRRDARANRSGRRQAPVVVEAGAELDRPRTGRGRLLSPFDNLLWEFQSVRRVLGYEHVIELYKPEPQRRYGYYVLPFLWRDRIVGRADLKSERREGDARRQGVPSGAGRPALERAGRCVRACSRPAPARRWPGARDQGRPLA